MTKKSGQMKKITLILIFFLALFLRVYHLSSVPPSLYWDEVSLGYNALTIAETGRDEHGQLLPLTNFAAFGDYKPPAYIYAIVPFIKMFGANEFAVRFPSALAGTLLVLVTFFLTLEILKVSHKKLQANATKISLVSAFFIAASPWAIQMSRAAFEANLATLFTAVGALCFLLGLRKKTYPPFIFSAVFFSLTIYTFNSHRIFVPILIAILTVLFARQLLKIWPKMLLFCLLLALIVIPIVPHMLSKEGKLRFNEVTWLNDLDLVVDSNKQIAAHGSTPLANLVYNRRIFYAKEFAKHYLDHFGPKFLFQTGDVNARLSTQAVGEFYLLDAILLLAGIFALLKFRSKGALLVALWILTAPIPASFARETPHALRILNMLPMPQILSATGLVYLFVRWKPISILIAVIMPISIFLYLTNYYLVYPNLFSRDWQYGYKQVVEEVKKQESHYDKISITGKYGRPYIYFLFYNQTPLSVYLNERKAGFDNFGFYKVDRIGKYDFTMPVDPKKNWLYVKMLNGSSGSKSGTIIKDRMGQPLFEITTKP